LCVVYFFLHFYLSLYIFCSIFFWNTFLYILFQIFCHPFVSRLLKCIQFTQLKWCARHSAKCVDVIAQVNDIWMNGRSRKKMLINSPKSSITWNGKSVMVGVNGSTLMKLIKIYMKNVLRMHTCIETILWEMIELNLLVLNSKLLFYLCI